MQDQALKILADARLEIFDFKENVQTFQMAWLTEIVSNKILECYNKKLDEHQSYINILITSILYL